MDIPEETPYEETEVRHEIEVYDPESLSKKYSKDQDTASETYILYPNTDLKYLKERKLDLQRLRKYNPNIPELHMESLDTVVYRLKECVRTGSTMLDLSNLGLTQIPPVNRIPPTIKYLFLGNNSLNYTTTTDLTGFRHLKVLDICNNQFDRIPRVPPSIEEVSCRGNNLTDISDLSQYRVKRLDLSHNNLTNIPDLPLLEILVCTDNKVSQLGVLPSIKKISMSNNNLSSIGPYNRLTLLDADKNGLTRVHGCPNLEEVYVNFNSLDKIDGFDRVKVLHISGNKINKLPYLRDLKELMCNSKEVQELSKQYKIKDAIKYKDETMLICFD